jgi:hypothetical protein
LVFLTANVCDLSIKANVITVVMLIILQVFGLDVNIFLTLTMYQETQGFTVLISGYWADF